MIHSALLNFENKFSIVKILRYQLHISPHNCTSHITKRACLLFLLLLFADAACRPRAELLGIASQASLLFPLHSSTHFALLQRLIFMWINTKKPNNHLLLIHEVTDSVSVKKLMNGTLRTVLN